MLPSLTRLSWCCCSISSTTALLQLTCLTGLRALELLQGNVWSDTARCVDKHGTSSAVDAVLDSLTQLTHLRLCMPLSSDAAPAAIGNMQQLKVFDMSNLGKNVTPKVLSSLPCSVTKLHLLLGMHDQDDGALPKQLPQLMALR